MKMFKEITRSFFALVHPLSIKGTNIRYTQYRVYRRPEQQAICNNILDYRERERTIYRLGSVCWTDFKGHYVHT